MLKRYVPIVAVVTLMATAGIAAAYEAYLTASPAAQPDDDHCINCHTSEALLQALAVEEEAGEALSEGPG